MRATLIIIAVMLFLGWYGVSTIDQLLAKMPGAIVACNTDADCHAKNPGVCAADAPYCF